MNKLGISIISILSIGIIGLYYYKNDNLDIKNKKLEEKIINEVQENIKKNIPKKLLIDGIPDERMTKREVLELMNNENKAKPILSGIEFMNDHEHKLLITETFFNFIHSNPQHLDVYPEILQIENTIIKIVGDLFKLPDNGCGMLSNSGTESIFLAMVAYKRLAKKRGIENPEVIMCETTHISFHKACYYLELKPIMVRQDESGRIDLELVNNKINKNTILIVGSAPNYPHGIVDNIFALSKLCLENNIYLHVDASYGGLLVQMCQPETIIDFRNKGVSSISIDLYHYGYCPKSTSLILYKDRNLRRQHFFITDKWAGGLYLTPSFSGHRSGALIATCLATILYFGYNGYKESYNKILALTLELKEKLKKQEHIKVLYDPQVSIISFTCKNIDSIYSRLYSKGWLLTLAKNPDSIQICITHEHTKIDNFADKLINDIQENEVNENEPIYSKINVHKNNKEVIYEYLNTLY